MITELAEKRSIPSLDGLRAVAVLMVIFAHSESSVWTWIPLSSFLREGRYGVDMFFLISGFLITHLLLGEQERFRTISLKRFYLRRTFRIFPPFYAFLVAVIAVNLLSTSLVNSASFAAILTAASYTWNYTSLLIHLQPTWILAHSWSLSLEEQFYLLWPVCMALFKRSTNVKIALSVIVLSPASRVLTYYFWPASRGYINTMFHTHLDPIMMGCLMSLMISSEIGKKVIQIAVRPSVAIAAVGFMLLVDGPAERHWHGLYEDTVGITLLSIAMLTLLLYSVFQPGSALGRVLNSQMLRHVGKISYGLYLWQQFFTGPNTRLFPLNVILIIGCAEVSYFTIEKPSFLIRDRLLRSLGRFEEAKGSGS